MYPEIRSAKSPTFSSCDRFPTPTRHKQHLWKWQDLLIIQQNARRNSSKTWVPPNFTKTSSSHFIGLHCQHSVTDTENSKNRKWNPLKVDWYIVTWSTTWTSGLYLDRLRLWRPQPIGQVGLYVTYIVYVDMFVDVYLENSRHISGNSVLHRVLLKSTKTVLNAGHETQWLILVFACVSACLWSSCLVCSISSHTCCCFDNLSFGGLSCSCTRTGREHALMRKRSDPWPLEHDVTNSFVRTTQASCSQGLQWNRHVEGALRIYTLSWILMQSYNFLSCRGVFVCGGR